MISDEEWSNYFVKWSDVWWQVFMESDFKHADIRDSIGTLTSVVVSTVLHNPEWAAAWSMRIFTNPDDGNLSRLVAALPIEAH